MPVSVAFSLRGYPGSHSPVLFILSEVLLLTRVLDEETKASWLNPAECGLRPRQYQVERDLAACVIIYLVRRNHSSRSLESEGVGRVLASMLQSPALSST